jgi:hypothetical protein
MRGLLRPVGPEPGQTYWARRALVFAAAIVLAIAVGLIISGMTDGPAAQPNPPMAAYLSIPRPRARDRPSCKRSGKRRAWMS